MRIFALIPALAAFVTAVPVDAGCGLETGRGDVESYVALSTAPPDTEIVTHSGVIEVLDSNDNRLGYVSKNLYKNGQLINDPLYENALVVTFTTAQTGAGYSTKLYLTTTVCLNPSAILGFSSHCH